ncbi:metallophosphoesterase [Natronospora cellulosivora (SeqCode)]
MINKILKQNREEIVKSAWIFSDLQQSIPEKARESLTKAVEDYKSLEMNCDKIWYLGDATEGNRLDFLKEMCEMHLELLIPLNIPLRYVMGNHDFDYSRNKQKSGERVIVPFYNTIKSVADWRTIDSLSNFYFIEEFGDFQIVFLSDHCSEKGEWYTTHGKIHGDKDKYPYSKEDFRILSEKIKKTEKATISVSHYAFAGGTRPSENLNQMLPLPENHLLHFYGHAHIGDAVWGKENLYRKVSWVDNQDIRQFNVSSLENRRGSSIRSVFLEIYKDNSLGIFFRDHQQMKWSECYLLSSSQDSKIFNG